MFKGDEAPTPPPLKPRKPVTRQFTSDEIGAAELEVLNGAGLKIGAKLNISGGEEDFNDASGVGDRRSRLLAEAKASDSHWTILGIRARVK